MKVKCTVQKPTTKQILFHALFMTAKNAIGCGVGIALAKYFIKQLQAYFSDSRLIISMIVATGAYASSRIIIAYTYRELALIVNIVTQKIVFATVEKEDGRVYNTVNSIDFLTNKYNLKVNIEETEKLDTDELHNKNNKED